MCCTVDVVGALVNVQSVSDYWRFLLLLNSFGFDQIIYLHSHLIYLQ